MISDERAQQIIEQGLESSCVNQRQVVAVITGLMGSGKTTLLSRLFNTPPPKIYTSMGLVEQSFRSLLHHIGHMGVGAGLVAVAIYGQGLPLLPHPQEPGDHQGIGSVG